MKSKHMPPAEAARELAEIGTTLQNVVRRLDTLCQMIPGGLLEKIEAVPNISRLEASQGEMLCAIAEEIEVEA